jgi:hypothetical protein
MSVVLRRRLFLAVVVTGCAYCFGLAQAEAHLTFPVFTYHPDCSGGPIDPINVAFLGSDAVPAVIHNHVAYHAGWKEQQGGNQAIKTHGGCHQMDEQASLGFKDKHHVRFFPNPDSPYDTFGDAHRERKKFCPKLKDAVYPRYKGRSGFDYGAYEIYKSFQGTNHEYSGSRKYNKGPNRRTFTQCTGEKVAWNGRTLLFSGAWYPIHHPNY